MADETFSPEGEKRGNPRVQLGLAILVPPGDQKVMSENLSLKGCFLPQVDLGPSGNRVTIKIDLPGFGFFALEARIAHKGQNNQGTGLEFVFLDPEAEKNLTDFLNIFSSNE